MTFDPVIGLEIHVQLNTETKMFCGCKNDPDSYMPNSSICPVCMGHPGVLPVANRKAVAFAVQLASSLECTIHTNSKFDRKHYFYPDLPKGYQISQYDEPIATDGKLTFFSNGIKRTIRFERLHLEEDAAKLIHVPGSGSLVDFNRAGTPLVEMVTKPDFTSSEDARNFLQELRRIVRTLGVSEGDMEKGQLRCDANISLRPTDETFEQLKSVFPTFTYERRLFWPKTEIKNLNSFKSVERALEYEIHRQRALWEQGMPPMEQQTRGWNDDSEETQEQRSKESLADYRYLPEPDLPRIALSEQWLSELISELPELPSALRERYETQYHIAPAFIDVLVDTPPAARFFEEVVSEIRAWELASDVKHEVTEEEKHSLRALAASWIVSKLFETLHSSNLSFAEMKLSAENFAELLYLVWKKKITSTNAVSALTHMVVSGEDPSHVMHSKGLEQLDDEEELKKIVESVIASHPQQTQEYKAGKEALLQFFIGQVMKQTKGRANPEKTAEMLKVFLR